MKQQNRRPSRYKLAVGISYDQNQSKGAAAEAPAVKVKGEEALADKVVTLANRYRIPVVEDPALARSLANLALDQEIPPSLFEAVAVLLTQLERTVAGPRRR